MVSERTSDRAFFVVSAQFFAASAVVTIVCRASMSAMGEMPMPGRGTMSMAWMRIPGRRTRAPPLVPMLWRYLGAVAGTGGRGIFLRVGHVRYGGLCVVCRAGGGRAAAAGAGARLNEPQIVTAIGDIEAA
jgi:hypothetical protein